RVPEVRHHGGVDVEAAGVREALAGEHVEAATGVAADHARVEGAGAEVVDDRIAADGNVRPDRAHEIGRGRDRLGGEQRRGQAGGDRGAGEGLATLRRPRGRVG